MKACPGLRSGIDRSGSLSFAIRGIPSPFAASLRQSGPPFVIPAIEGMPRTLIRGRNPEGVGRGKTTRRWKKPTRHPIFILLCGLRRAMVIPAINSMPRTPIRGGNPGEGRPAHPCHIESLWAVPPQPTVLVRSQFANAQDKLRSNLNSYGSGHQSTPPQCGRGACGRVLRWVRHSRIFPVYPNTCLLTVKQRDIMSRTSDLYGC